MVPSGFAFWSCHLLHSSCILLLHSSPALMNNHTYFSRASSDIPRARLYLCFKSTSLVQTYHISEQSWCFNLSAYQRRLCRPLFKAPELCRS
ncbi:hypothetical protein B0O80DRAFT_432186 [Mortierella sp. GBAus27b]|nr:hypothetical protein B0O80DRAFT_432186 [Mortierella sp. GBAus27b]